MKIALFDFCETLVNYQTADYFVEYVLKKYKRNGFYSFIMAIKPANRYLAKNWMIRKHIHLYQMKGLGQKEIDAAANEFFLKYIEPNQFNSMVELIEEYQKNGYKTYIVSGGYEPYIRYYAEKHNMDGIVANEFSYKETSDKKFSGKLTREDCMGAEKVNRLNEMFAGVSIEDSIGFSDSLSDLPMLNWCNKKVLVSKYKERKCAAENGLDPIVLCEKEAEDVSFEFDGIIKA